jgi:hypothetical protein
VRVLKQSVEMVKRFLAAAPLDLLPDPVLGRRKPCLGPFVAASKPAISLSISASSW